MCHNHLLQSDLQPMKGQFNVHKSLYSNSSELALNNFELTPWFRTYETNSHTRLQAHGTLLQSQLTTSLEAPLAVLLLRGTLGDACTRFAMYAAFCRRCFSHSLRFCTTHSLLIPRGWASHRTLARRKLMLPRSRLLVACVTGRLHTRQPWVNQILVKGSNLLYAWLTILVPTVLLLSIRPRRIETPRSGIWGTREGVRDMPQS